MFEEHGENRRTPYMRGKIVIQLEKRKMWGCVLNVKKLISTAVGKMEKSLGFKENLTEYLCRGNTHLLEWVDS
jgi:hypothetical protein